MANITFKTGNDSDLHILKKGEPVITNSNKVYIGNEVKNVQILTEDDKTEINNKINQLFQSGVDLQNIAKTALNAAGISYDNDQLSTLINAMKNNLYTQDMKNKLASAITNAGGTADANNFDSLLSGINNCSGGKIYTFADNKCYTSNKNNAYIIKFKKNMTISATNVYVGSYSQGFAYAKDDTFTYQPGNGNIYEWSSVKRFSRIVNCGNYYEFQFTTAAACVVVGSNDIENPLNCSLVDSYSKPNDDFFGNHSEPWE